MTEATPIIATTRGRELLKSIAAELEVNAGPLSELLHASQRHSGQLRRKGLFQAFDAILDQAGR